MEESENGVVIVAAGTMLPMRELPLTPSLLLFTEISNVL
jgi:hypothetical protein